ncbi:TRPL translocation defect protein 14-like [Amphiura filiformis]|uniref:TRPL translocation defect protein 14-like n=1 Tax=Amphiura filiformis TaxID=82378 RepID=UPI003B21D4C7
MLGGREIHLNGEIVNEISQKKAKKVYKVVLTGGPCGGKTTGQAFVSTFFENLGWKVFRVPETATHLLSGGIKVMELDEEEAYRFQYNLIQTMLFTENTYFELAESSEQNCLIICDRGTMDAVSYMMKGHWERMKEEFNWDNISMRDKRYDQVIHLVSAAKGAEDFYTKDNNAARFEDCNEAKESDDRTCQAWVGHPYFDVIDNSTGFERKIARMVAIMCDRMGLTQGDKIRDNSQKRKFLISSLPDKNAFPSFEDFEVEHIFLAGPDNERSRLRKRGQRGLELSDRCLPGSYTYQHSLSKPSNGQHIQTRTTLTSRQYQILAKQRDGNRFKIMKTRRCFLWNDMYYQMDIYKKPQNPRCAGVIILETYTTTNNILEKDQLIPDFLDVRKEVTDDQDYSMYNLCKKEAAEE